MHIHTLLSFIPVALLLAFAPGPDNLGVLALGVSRGRRESLAFAIGCAAGCLNHTLLAALGISALIAASPLAFHILQYSGAAYLATGTSKNNRGAVKTDLLLVMGAQARTGAKLIVGTAGHVLADSGQ